LAALLIVLAGTWLWGAPGHRDFDRALLTSELQDALREAQISLLRARVDLDEGNLLSASRQLEEARGLLRRADERGTRLGWPGEAKRLDLARFEADIDEAQRLLGQLDRGAGSLGPRRQTLAEGVPRWPMSLRQ
jgi:hypothetical protein